jgi:co-chaperonin GroES (HSP10)
MPYDPTWKRYEKDLTSDDSVKAKKAAEAFDDERTKETKSNKKAHDWERDRKSSILKDKPNWKRKQLKEEKQKLDSITDKLRDAGKFDDYMTPAPGYILVERDQKENKTQSGIYISGSELPDNSGYVVGVGSGQLLATGYTVQSPCKVGDKIFYKRGAGIEIELKGEKYKFMQFSDVLGIFH